MEKLLLWALSVASLAAAAPGVAYTDCGSTFVLEGVDIAGCRRLPCPVYAGQTMNITTKFTANAAANSVTNDVYFKVNFVDVPASITSYTCSDDGGCCSNPDENCYIAEGETLEYSAQVLASDNMPPVFGELVWEMYNEVQHKIICYKVDVAIMIL